MGRALFSIIISPIIILCFADRIYSAPAFTHCATLIVPSATIRAISDTDRALKAIPGEIIKELSMTQKVNNRSRNLFGARVTPLNCSTPTLK